MPTQKNSVQQLKHKASESIVSEQLKRLHITPFTPQLYDLIIPASLRDSTQNVSFHHIKTFPENAYGYAELPVMGAQKLKKLNGAILKGQKIHVTDARPEKRRKSSEAEDGSDNDVRGTVSKRRKSKSSQDDDVMMGVDLPENRHVKRGWVESAKEGKKKSTKKSSGRTKSEDVRTSGMLFRTSVPPNRCSISPKADKLQDKEKKRKKGSRIQETKGSGRKKIRKDNTALGNKPVSEHVKNVGWIDEKGEVVEPERHSNRVGTTPASRETIPTTALDQKDAVVTGEEDSCSNEISKDKTSPDLSVNSPSTASKGTISPTHRQQSTALNNELDKKRSSLATKSTEKEPKQRQVSFALSDRKPITEVPMRDGERPVTSTDKEAHPLEQIFKHSKSTDKGAKLAPINTSFSFFDEDRIMDSEPRDPPQTPFTKQDRQFRRIRSPAPTPDTAAVNRKHKLPWEAKNGDASIVSEAAEDMNEDREFSEELAQLSVEHQKDEEIKKGEEKNESDFAKWFWEHRGENNRAWRRKRREALKSERQKINKRSGFQRRN